MITSTTECERPDLVSLNQWYPLAALDEIPPGRELTTLLLGEEVSYSRSEDSGGIAWKSRTEPTRGGPTAGGSESDPALRQHLPTKESLGYLWTTLGEPPAELFDIPEFHDPQRRNLNAGSIVVATSAPRAVENFLDLAHLPHVHTGVLGDLPHTEVPEYDTSTVDGELVARNCLCYVPQFAPTETGTRYVSYDYRVPHITCVLLSCPSSSDPSRPDIYALFVQPMTEELVRAHNYVGVIDDVSSDTDIRHFQLLIFGQDKPILESQRPKRLPLDPRAETPIRADESGIAYRRWLSDLGVTYGVIPATD